MPLSKERKAEYNRRDYRRRKSSILKPSQIPKTVSPSGVFVPLEPCYVDLLEQEYRQYGGLAEHIGKLLIAKAKEVDQRVAEHLSVVIPIDHMPEY